jgi:hypothetical protein
MAVADPLPLTAAEKANFDTLSYAFGRGDVCVMRSHIRASGQPVALLCGLSQLDGEDIAITPLGVLTWDNPYELFADPAEEATDGIA